MAIANKKTIKLYFVDFWNGFDPANNFFFNRIKLYFNIILSENDPDFLFYSWNGNKYLKYKNCIKIYFTGENDVPDFNLCDYAIGFHHIRFADRYLRLPLFVLYPCYAELPLCSPSEEEKRALLERKFCSFVVSNSQAADPIRDYFFAELNKYKKIDSGGRHLNNIGYNIPDKQEFIAQYKFNLAFENSKVPGYTTEKLHQPLAARTMPVYWGNPEVDKDFNKDAFIFINDFDTAEAAIAEIIRLDNNDEAYLEKLLQPAIDPKQNTINEWVIAFDTFIINILAKDKDNASELTKYGYSAYYRNRRAIVECICSLPGLKYIIRKAGHHS